MADELQTHILIRILDAFTGPLRNLQTGLGDVDKAADRIKGKFKLAADLNQAAESAGKFGNFIRAPLENAVKEFIGFEREMSKVSALSGEMAGSEGFEKLKTQALELGAATAYSAEEAAQAQAQYAQAGRSVNEILQVTPLTLAAAKANGTGLAETAAIIGHTMSGMGIATGETARVVDVLTAAAAASDASLQDIGQALAFVGPVARQAHMPLELTAAYIGKLKDAGLEASAAGTGLRATISRLLDPSREATKAFGQLGIKAGALKELQKAVAGGHLDDALRQIGTAADKLPTEQRMKLMSQIFGLEASTAASIAITASMDTSDKGVGALNDALHKVDGTTLKLAGVMEDNLGGSLERAGGAISGLNTKIGEILKPTVEGAAGAVERLAGRMTKWTAENPKAAKATLELVAGLGALSFGLKGVLVAASTWTSASAMAEAAFLKLSGSLLGKMGLVAAAGAAGYAIGTWINETFELDKKISDLLGRKGSEQAAHQGLKPGDTEVHKGGWTVSGATGEVIGMGTGAGPQSVRAARAAGARTKAEINAFIRQRALENRLNPGRSGGTLLEQQASALGRSTSPLLDIDAPQGPLAAAPAQGASTAAAMFTAATREQTDALLETLRKQEANTAAIAKALTARPAGRPVSVPGAGVYP